MSAGENWRLSRRWLGAALAAGLLAGVLPLLASIHPLLGILAFGGVLVILLLGLAWPFSGVAILIVAALLTRYRFEIGSLSVRPEHLAALAVAGLGLLHMLVQRQRPVLTGAVVFAFAWWGMNLIAGLFFSPIPMTGLQSAVRIFVLALTFFLVLNLIPNRQQWRWAVIFFLAAGVAEAAFGILARVLYPLGINLGVQVTWSLTEPVPYGTFEEGNLFGSHIAAWALTLLMLLLADGASQRPWWQKVIGGSALLVLLLGLYLSLSRAAWLVFAVGSVLIWAMARRQPWLQTNRLVLSLTLLPFTAVMILIVAQFLPATWPFVDRLQSFTNLSTDATFMARLEDWSLAWKDWRLQPLTGWGPNSFFDLHGEIRARPAWISNISLRLLQETGVLGALFFVGFVISLILPVVAALRRPLHSQRNPEDCVTHNRLLAQRNPEDYVTFDRAALLGLTLSYLVLVGLAYQSTDGIWLTASWVHAGLIAAGARSMMREA